MNQSLSPQPATSMKPEDPKKRIIWTTVIVALAVLLALGVVAWYFFFGPGKNKTTSINSGFFKTIKWNKFENKTYGFTIKYPTGWEYKNEGTKTSFRPQNTQDFLLSIDVKNETLALMIEAQKKQFAPNSTFENEEMATIAGEKAIKLSFINKTDQTIRSIVYLIDKNSKIYVITGEGAAGKYNETVKRMIESFQFEKSSSGNEEEMAFDVLAAGSISSSTAIEEKNYVFKNNDEFKELWNKIYSFSEQGKTLPEVDFSQAMVIAAMAKQAGNGGFEIEISKILEKQTNIEVFIKEISLAAGCPVTQIMNQPFEFVKITKTTKEIQFIPQPETKNCQ